MRNWTDAIVCRNRTACGNCRDTSAAGDAFRASCARAFQLPPTPEGAAPHWFECPHGIPADSPPPLPERAASYARALASRLTTRR